MRSIYLGKRKVIGRLMEAARNKPNVYECPSCGGPQIARPVGFTLAGEAVYSCRDPWHVRIGQ